MNNSRVKVEITVIYDTSSMTDEMIDETISKVHISPPYINTELDNLGAFAEIKLMKIDKMERVY